MCDRAAVNRQKMLSSQGFDGLSLGAAWGRDTKISTESSLLPLFSGHPCPPARIWTIRALGGTSSDETTLVGARSVIDLDMGEDVWSRL